MEVELPGEGALGDLAQRVGKLGGLGGVGQQDEARRQTARESVGVDETVHKYRSSAQRTAQRAVRDRGLRGGLVGGFELGVDARLLRVQAAAARAGEIDRRGRQRGVARRGQADRVVVELDDVIDLPVLQARDGRVAGGHRAEQFAGAAVRVQERDRLRCQLLGGIDGVDDRVAGLEAVIGQVDRVGVAVDGRARVERLDVVRIDEQLRAGARSQSDDGGGISRRRIGQADRAIGIVDDQVVVVLHEATDGAGVRARVVAAADVGHLRAIGEPGQTADAVVADRGAIERLGGDAADRLRRRRIDVGIVEIDAEPLGQLNEPGRRIEDMDVVGVAVGEPADGRAAVRRVEHHGLVFLEAEVRQRDGVARDVHAGLVEADVRAAEGVDRAIDPRRDIGLVDRQGDADPGGAVLVLDRLSPIEVYHFAVGVDCDRAVLRRDGGGLIDGDVGGFAGIADRHRERKVVGVAGEDADHIGGADRLDLGFRFRARVDADSLVSGDRAADEGGGRRGLRFAVADRERDVWLKRAAHQLDMERCIGGRVRGDVHRRAAVDIGAGQVDGRRGGAHVHLRRDSRDQAGQHAGNLAEQAEAVADELVDIVGQIVEEIEVLGRRGDRHLAAVDAGLLDVDAGVLAGDEGWREIGRLPDGGVVGLHLDRTGLETALVIDTRQEIGMADRDVPAFERDVAGIADGGAARVQVARVERDRRSRQGRDRNGLGGQGQIATVGLHRSVARDGVRRRDGQPSGLDAAV